ncbi:putative transcriptional regulator [Scheffersomyces xylosifermentans]|uniref:putative transcriptional regulator n=1 Tax=Scheffersomyces xylosifermentans TaxID=1304137 RepID=UPI00315D5CF4
MYFVLDLYSSLETVESKNSPTPASGNVKSKRIFTKNIVVGPSKRSRNGCVQCRQRKKKCDESYPVCGACKYRKVECDWREGSKFKIQKTPSTDGRDTIKQMLGLEIAPIFEEGNFEETQDPLLEVEESAVDFEGVNDELFSNNVAMVPDNDFSSLPSEFADKNIDLLLNNNSYDLIFPSPTNSIIFNPFRHLDETGNYFLDGFINKVARKLCIGPDTSNYFLKTFYQLAEEDKSISYALAAWGGLFVENYSTSSKEFMRKACVSIAERFRDFNNLTKKDIYLLLNFFLIGVGIQVCAGDVSKWNILFKKCIEVIQKNGGLNAICQMFDYSNDIKWLISDVQFHDIMSSRAFTRGTILPMEEYNNIFKTNKILELGNYGLDPLQGCIQPIYLLLGEILSKASQLKERKAYINLREYRLEYYAEVEQEYQSLKEKIRTCQPNINQMSVIIHDRNEVELHLTLFEVISYTCQLCMNYQIKHLPASSYEMQTILVNALNCVDILVGTKMTSALSLSMLLCGITCCTPNDRAEMDQRLATVVRTYKVANLRRIVDIIHEVWTRNQDGNICVDWIDVCEEKNWDLSVC